MVENSTGLALGETGAKTLSIDDLGMRLAARDPKEATALLLDGLRASHGIVFQMRASRTQGQPSLSVNLQPSQGALDLVEKFFVPLPTQPLYDGLIELLGGLRIFSGSSHEDRDIMIAPFMRELRKYPADCALAAIRAGRKHGVKIQAEDLGKDAAKLMGDRGMIRNAIEYAKKNPDDVKWSNMTPEDREKNRLEVLAVIQSYKDKEGPPPVRKTAAEVAAALRAKIDDA